MAELEMLQLKETKMLARIKASKSVCENMLKEPGFLGPERRAQVDLFRVMKNFLCMMQTSVLLC